MSDKTVSSVQQALEERLSRVIQEYVNDVPYNPWFNERNRWHELVVCLLFAYGGKAGETARSAAAVLEELGLLDVIRLAELPWVNNGPDVQHSDLALMRNVLERIGFASEDASTVTCKIVRVARDLRTKYNGYVQAYLRQHGQRMLSDLQSDFPSLAATDQRLQYAFAVWLQNVLTMPVFVITDGARRFCEDTGCTPDELQQAADQLNINTSLLDDILDLWEADQESVLTPLGEQTSEQQK